LFEIRVFGGWNRVFGDQYWVFWEFEIGVFWGWIRVFLRGLKYKLSKSEIRSSGGVKLGLGGGGFEIRFWEVLK